MEKMSGKMQTRENSKGLNRKPSPWETFWHPEHEPIFSGICCPHIQATGAFRAARVLHCNAPGMRRRSLKQHCSRVKKRDSLEPANERHTAFGGTCDGSWELLGFISVWDFPRHLRCLGTHFSLASIETTACGCLAFLTTSLTVTAGKRPFIFGGNLFASGMERNISLKIFSSKEDKAAWA